MNLPKKLMKSLSIVQPNMLVRILGAPAVLLNDNFRSAKAANDSRSLPTVQLPKYQQATDANGLLCHLSLFAMVFAFAVSSTIEASQPSAADYASLQAAIDANRGRAVFVPAGSYVISEKLRLSGDMSGLFGPGRIIQSNADQPIIGVQNGEGICLQGLTLTRSEDAMETSLEGIIALNCNDLVIERVSIIDNHTRSGAITLRDCRRATATRCFVKNYMRVTTDDRTSSLEWGYAFNATDGTGITISSSTGTLIEGNRILEERLMPTPELKEKYKLGDFVKRNPVKGSFISQAVWDAGYGSNWQQGSGLIVASPEVSDLTRIVGNHIENAAQGIDLHSDHVIVSNNVVTNSFIGMKAMHGSRNVLISGNQFHKNSLWAIGLMPGAAAHAGNTDGGSIISNNVISDFGHGDAHWIWGTGYSPIKFDTGQEEDDPPLAEVIVQGNIVHCIGKPRYSYAVVLPNGPRGPREVKFSNNLFHPGTEGVSNSELHK